MVVKKVREKVRPGNQKTEGTHFKTFTLIYEFAKPLPSMQMVRKTLRAGFYFVNRCRVIPITVMTSVIAACTDNSFYSTTELLISV